MEQEQYELEREQERQYRQSEEQQFEYQLQCDIEHAENFLLKYGYIVIPRSDIAKYMGKFDIVPQKEVEFDPNELPF